ncbi:MAG: YIP1 family protein [Anaerolineaceae bacterium]|nr:YIP1 family protein [Anaerolineaceae bacterium]
MKKVRVFLLLLVGLLLVALPVQAQSPSPYQTYTLGPGQFYWYTQAAYTPLGEFPLPLDGPEDMFYAPDGYLYVADTGNSRIVKLDANFGIIDEFGADVLNEPTGLFVDEDGVIYVADGGSDTIVILDAEGQIINQFGRPSEPLFGLNREFLPRKIAVDARKNLYIVSEGSVNGLVMMNTNGNFIGYFGANAAEMSVKMILQRLLLSDEQLEQFIRNEAASPSNLAIDDQSLVYTITAGTERDKSIRKFNIAGKNLFDEWILGSPTFRDIHVSDTGLMLAVDSFGYIAEYDLDGTLLFWFGAQDRGDQRVGLLSNPTAIERIGDNIYVLDKNKNAIITYQVTDFARRLHEGVRLYTEGYYTEARPYFEDVLNFNGLVLMAYQGLADADYKDQNYTGALANYRTAGDRNGYSETFWELRNAVLQRYLGAALGVMLGLWLFFKIFNRLEKRFKWLDPVRRLGNRLKKIKLVDDFLFMFRFIKQPVDSFYYIKQNMRGSLRFAFIIFAWVLIVRVLSLYLTGFVFSPYSVSWMIFAENEIIYTILPLALWIVANYLIASISDGEGPLRHVIIGTAYSLWPYVLFALPITLISNVLTLNEAFLYSFSSQLMLFWTLIMLVIMVKEIHNYSLNETLRNIFTTLFTMAIFLLTAYILYVLFNQLYEFVLAISQEASLRG